LGYSFVKQPGSPPAFFILQVQQLSGEPSQIGCPLGNPEFQVFVTHPKRFLGTDL
jgi:hypothetical protein